MIKIKREMQKTETIETTYYETQVSFNSDGVLPCANITIMIKIKTKLLFSRKKKRKKL